MISYDLIWHTQDEIRTVVNAVLGEYIWNLSYSERRIAIELELTVTSMMMPSAIYAVSSPSLPTTTESEQKDRNLYFICECFSRKRMIRRIMKIIKKNGSPPQPPVNLKSNTMKNTMQRYVFIRKLQESSTKKC